MHTYEHTKDTVTFQRRWLPHIMLDATLKPVQITGRQWMPKTQRLHQTWMQHLEKTNCGGEPQTHAEHI